MWWLVYLFLEVVWYLDIFISWSGLRCLAEQHLVSKFWKWSIGSQWLFLMFYNHFHLRHTDLVFVDRWKHFFINVLIFPLISLYTFPSPGLVSQSNILIPPPTLRSQGDLVTQPSQSKLDATIGCRAVAAFFNCPSITRPATEFYRDLKEKDAVISSVPKMRKKWGRFNYKRAQAQYASPDQECAQNDSCARNGFKNRKPHKGENLGTFQHRIWSIRMIKLARRGHFN